MATKLGKSELPSGHSREDFACFGPPATKDGVFEGTMVADLGCFAQDGRDTNKYYAASVSQSKKTQAWYAYFEWGRTGASKVDFQFVECDSKEEAQEEYCAQLHSKNDKRGEWTVVANMKTLRAKSGKDCYLVRAKATRETGLPDARTITMMDGVKPSAKTDAVVSTKTKVKDIPVDTQTLSLMRDLNIATVNYTRSALGKDLPMQSSIDEGRQILAEAMKLCVKLGDSSVKQATDPQMRSLTELLYGKIGKIKPIGAPIESWVLSKDNILAWGSDLDAFESALSTVSSSPQQVDQNPLAGMDLDMSYIDKTSSIGEWLCRYVPSATKGRHGYGKMRILNIWGVRKPSTEKDFYDTQEKIARTKPRKDESPLFQGRRPDLGNRGDIYSASHTALLFHGTRSVNVSGILRKSLLMPRQLVGVVITGACFGPGLYFADDVGKSVGYTSLDSSYWSRGSGQVAGRKAFMFLSEVIIGTPHVAPGPNGYTKAPNNCHSVFGKAGHSSVQNNEWIVFEKEQHHLRYLIEFDTNR